MDFLSEEDSLFPPCCGVFFMEAGLIIYSALHAAIQGLAIFLEAVDETSSHPTQEGRRG